MCEYCNQRYNEPFYQNDKDCITLKISDKYSKNNTIRIINGLKEHRVLINYCPMCGRKLI